MTPLSHAFEKRVAEQAIPDWLRDALYEAFMAGAHAHEVEFNKAVETNDPKKIAEVLDAMALEISQRRTKIAAKWGL